MIRALIENFDLTVDDLAEIVHGPDFPTGGTIFRFEDQRNTLTGERERRPTRSATYAYRRARSGDREARSPSRRSAPAAWPSS